MGDYGYLHIGRVLSQDLTSGGYYLESVALARDRKFGPCPSCVPGLVAGDRVVLAATGTSRDSLVILGMLDPRYPDIGNIPGLTAALAAKADQTDLDALAASTDSRLDTAEADIDALQAADVSLDSRLDTAESTITSHTATIGTHTSDIASHTSTLSTHTTQIGVLQTYHQVFRDAHEFDVYGDVLSSFPRLQMANIRTLTPQAAYIWRTRMRLSVAFNRVRVVVQAAGTGASGSCTGTLLTSSTAAGPYTVAGTATNTLTATGTQDFVFGATANVAAGTYVILMLWCNNSYTATPKITAWTGTIQVNVGGLNPTIIWGTKTGLTSAPTSVTITDGTWTADTAPWWIAAAN